RDLALPAGSSRRQDPRSRVPRLRAGARPAPDVLRAVLPGHGRVGRGRADRSRADVLDLPRELGPQAARDSGDPCRDRDRRLPRGLPARAGRGRPGPGAGRDGGGGRVEAGRRARGLDPRHRVLPARAGERAVIERIARPEEVRRWPGSIPVAHRYTPGVAGEAFLRALRDRGVILGSRCERCRYTYVPARLFCERCFGELAADVEVGPGGVLRSFTIGFVGLEGEPLDLPVTLGL